MFRVKSSLYPPCKKHPRHRQSPGVCSICLNEKLSSVSHSSSSSSGKGGRAIYSSSSSSSLSSLSSSDISSCASSRHMSPRHAIQMSINASEGRASSYKFSSSFSGDLLLGTSKSVAVVGRPIHETADKDADDHDDDDHINNNHNIDLKRKKQLQEKKRSGFWSKLSLSRPRGSKRITDDLHLHRVCDQGFMYSQPLIRKVSQVINCSR